MKTRDWMAVIVGGIAMLLACVLAGVEMARSGFAWLIVPVILALFWRERVFARLRTEADSAHQFPPSANSPI